MTEQIYIYTFLHGSGCRGIRNRLLNLIRDLYSEIGLWIRIWKIFGPEGADSDSDLAFLHSFRPLINDFLL